VTAAGLRALRDTHAVQDRLREGLAEVER